MVDRQEERGDIPEIDQLLGGRPHRLVLHDFLLDCLDQVVLRGCGGGCIAVALDQLRKQRRQIGIASVTFEILDAEATIESHRRDRMAEIQRFKNSRLVGENHYGLLTIREAPAGPYGQRVQETVDAENADRKALMKDLAAEHHVAQSRIEADQAALWRERAFPGEWIEQQQPDGTWKWVQKRASDTGGGGSAAPPAP